MSENERLGADAPTARRRPSIATRRGDVGKTTVAGGARVSKGDARVEAYGAIDELGAVMGFARTRTDDSEICAAMAVIGRELFAVGSAVATKPEAKQPAPEVTKAMVQRLDALVERWEAEPGVLRDWSLPGECAASAPFDVARTVCRRAERATVRYVAGGGSVAPTVLAYLNRLSDVLWLAARVIERRCGVDSALRETSHPGPPWSRAW